MAGYAVADDVTARDLQAREGQWTRAKGADGFCPFGPWITTADEIDDPHALALRTWVNGELRQDSNTSNLIFSVPELIEFIAETCTLQSGDVILTGTPGGVGIGLDPPAFLASGDVVRIEIERLGQIEHLSREGFGGREHAVACARSVVSITRSISPYSTAWSALKKRSRSMSACTCSMV